MVVKKKSTVTRWKISKLRDHPKQDEMFGDVDEIELAAFVENMRKNGLRTPIEITPNGIIITGHQRVRAAKLLGWTMIDVVIRYDLAALGPDVVEAHFVEDNFIRRHLGPLAKARCIKRLVELESGRESCEFSGTRLEDLKARIAARMGLSTRSVNRYLLLLKAPVAVQQAFDQGRLSLVLAGRVAIYSKTVQAEIARRIATNEKPAAVIAEFSNRKGSDDAAFAFRRLVRTIVRELPHIRDRLGEAPALVSLKSIQPELREVVDLFNQLLSADTNHCPVCTRTRTNHESDGHDRDPEQQQADPSPAHARPDDPRVEIRREGRAAVHRRRKQ